MRQWHMIHSTMYKEMRSPQGRNNTLLALNLGSNMLTDVSAHALRSIFVEEAETVTFRIWTDAVLILGRDGPLLRPVFPHK